MILHADKIAASGQTFRAWVDKDQTHFISAGEYAIVEKNGTFTSTNDKYFHNYFDLDTDYTDIQGKLNLPLEIIKAGQGMRILRADYIEMVISFIISANNNIKRIKQIIAKLCEQYGEARTFGKIRYHAFPTLEKLSTINVNKFITLGCGYRAPYLVKAIQQLSTNTPLTSIMGVGPKVAACVKLFALHQLDVVPVDTHIQKSIDDGLTPTGEYAGVAQQYIFYCMTNKTTMCNG